MTFGRLVFKGNSLKHFQKASSSIRGRLLQQKHVLHIRTWIGIKHIRAVISVNQLFSCIRIVIPYYPFV